MRVITAYILVLAVVAATAFNAVADSAAVSGGSLLKVYTRPDGAEIVIDGVYEGTSPIERLPLPPGEYEVEWRLPGYVSGDTTVELGIGETRELTVYLAAGENVKWWSWKPIILGSIIGVVIIVLGIAEAFGRMQ